MKDLEQQLIDNENRVALMAAVICAGIIAQRNEETVDGQKIVNWSVGLALMIVKAVGKEAEKVRGEL